MGTGAAKHQSSVGWSHKQHPRPYLCLIPALFWPPDDGSAERPFHPPHHALPTHFASYPSNTPFTRNRRVFGVFGCSCLHTAQPSSATRHPLLRCLRCHWPDIHLLHPQPFQQSLASHGNSDEENADDDAERALVWTSVEWDAVGGRGVSLWGCGCRRLDAKEGEAGQGEVKKAKRALI